MAVRPCLSPSGLPASAGSADHVPPAVATSSWQRLEANSDELTVGGTQARRGLAHGAADDDHLRRQGILGLLAIKDSDVRMLTLEQCRDAVDKGLHAGGAFSATIPLVALFYGGFIDIDVVDPTRRGQDMFVLSKGHAVAAMASIYAELGYFDRRVLRNSRSYRKHPERPSRAGAAGRPHRDRPDGAGLRRGARAWPSPAAPRRASTPTACAGDGELQEGPIWEARHVRRPEAPRQPVRAGRPQQRPARPGEPHGVPHAASWRRCSRRSAGRRTASTPRSTTASTRPRAVPLRSAQRQADRDHLPRAPRATAPVRFPEQAQGDGRRRADGAGDRAAARAAPRPRRRIQPLPRRLDGPRAGARIQDALVETAPRACIWTVVRERRRRAAAARSVGPVRLRRAAAARQADPLRRRAAATHRQGQGVRRQRYRHGRDEGLRAAIPPSSRSIPTSPRPAVSKPAWPRSTSGAR